MSSSEAGTRYNRLKAYTPKHAHPPSSHRHHRTGGERPGSAAADEAWTHSMVPNQPSDVRGDGLATESGTRKPIDCVLPQKNAPTTPLPSRPPPLLHPQPSAQPALLPTPPRREDPAEDSLHFNTAKLPPFWPSLPPTRPQNLPSAPPLHVDEGFDDQDEVCLIGRTSPHKLARGDDLFPPPTHSSQSPPPCRGVSRSKSDSQRPERVHQESGDSPLAKVAFPNVQPKLAPYLSHVLTLIPQPPTSGSRGARIPGLLKALSSKRASSQVHGGPHQMIYWPFVESFPPMGPRRHLLEEFGQSALLESSRLSVSSQLQLLDINEALGVRGKTGTFWPPLNHESSSQSQYIPPFCR